MFTIHREIEGEIVIGYVDREGLEDMIKAGWKEGEPKVEEKSKENPKKRL